MEKIINKTTETLFDYTILSDCSKSSVNLPKIQHELYLTTQSVSPYYLMNLSLKELN